MMALALSVALSSAAVLDRSLKPSEIAHYSKSASSASARLPVGMKSDLLLIPNNETTTAWTRFLGANLKRLDQVYFPTGVWREVPGKKSRPTDVETFIIDRGAFRDVGVIQARIAVEDAGPSGQIYALALLELGNDYRPRKILKVIGGLRQAAELSGQPRLDFVTDNEIVVRFNGWVSDWQIVLTRGRGIEVKELR